VRPPRRYRDVSWIQSRSGTASLFVRTMGIGTAKPEAERCAPGAVFQEFAEVPELGPRRISLATTELEIARAPTLPGVSHKIPVVLKQVRIHRKFGGQETP